MRAFSQNRSTAEELNFIQGSTQEKPYVSLCKTMAGSQTWLHSGDTSRAMKASETWATLPDSDPLVWGASWSFHISSGGSNVQGYCRFHTGWDGRGKEGYYLLNSFKHHPKEKTFKNIDSFRLHF